MKTINTFSIVGYDPEANAWGVAVASKFLACASIVSWAEAGAGAVATQSRANLDYGELALPLLRKGYSAQKVLDALLALDGDISQRQVGIVDMHGGSAAYTGPTCADWAGHIAGPNFACQGNILAGPQVVQAMAESFRATEGGGLSLARRLVLALKAGEQTGGDGRGKQAAGVLVMTPGGSYGGYNGKLIDLRVDDSRQPVDDLLHLLDLQSLYFGKPKAENILKLEGETLRRLQIALVALGYAKIVTGAWDSETERALDAFAGRENFEERLLDGGRIDSEVLDLLCKLTQDA